MYINKQKKTRSGFNIYFSYKNSSGVSGYSASKKRTKYKIKLKWSYKIIHWCGHLIHMPYKATIIDQILKLIFPD